MRRRIVENLLLVTATLVVSSGLGSLLADDQSVQEWAAELQRQFPPSIPKGKVLCVKGAYKCKVIVGADSKIIEQSCDSVVCYFSNGDPKKFWITFDNMTTDSYDESGRKSTFTTSVYSDGAYVLRMTRWGADVQTDAPAQVEISAIGESYDDYSPYAVGVGYTLSGLLSESNPLFGAILTDASKLKISDNSQNGETAINYTTGSESGDVDVKCELILDNAKKALKLFTYGIVIKKDGVVTMDRLDKIEVIEWDVVEEGSPYFPKQATFTSKRNGKEVTSYSYQCRSVDIVSQFPPPPRIPPRSTVTDKRVGISVRTGDESSDISVGIDNYLEDSESVINN